MVCIRFSIIVADYDGSISPEIRQRFFNSLKNQSFKDFEIILMHDGPRSYPMDSDITGLNIIQNESVFRGNAWGHNLRSLGMKMSRGEYILHTNMDNIYYPNALELLDSSIESGYKVYIGEVKMMGLNKTSTKVWYDNPRDYTKFTILTGKPLQFGCIDMMNLVAHRDVWEDIHGWFDIIAQSDFIIYKEICSRFPYKYISVLFGEHY